MASETRYTAHSTPAPQYNAERLLPDPLPADPFPILQSWLDEATQKAQTPNPNAITLCTIDPDGRPAARIVLCKSLNIDKGLVTFFTNRQSRKGAALEADPRAAIVFHWDHLGLQARVEGVASRTTDAESDEYWRTRWILSRLGAWASDQSRPVESREAMLRRVQDAAKKFGAPMDGSADAAIPRPPHWGGYDVWADRVELWIGQPGRIHDRGDWTRSLTKKGDGFEAGRWSAVRLQP